MSGCVWSANRLPHTPHDDCDGLQSELAEALQRLMDPSIAPDPDIRLNGESIRMDPDPACPITVTKFDTVLPISAELLTGEPGDLPRPSWRVRLADWWYDHRPRLHFGPCPTDDEEW